MVNNVIGESVQSTHAHIYTHYTQVYESLTAHYAKVVARNEKKKKKKAGAAATAAAAADGGNGAEEGNGIVPHSVRLQHEAGEGEGGGEEMSA